MDFCSRTGVSFRRLRKAGRVLVALHRPTPVLPALLAAAWFAYCAWLLSPNPNPDSAVVAVMARDIASGGAPPTFFHGQPYMGSLEPCVSALLVRLFGPSPFVVALGTAALGSAAAIATAALAFRAAGPFGAACSLLLAVPGPVLWSSMNAAPLGGYALCALLCVAGLWIACDGDGGPAGSAVWRTAGRCAAFGVVCGLAWWNTWLALPSLLASGLVLLARLGRGALRPAAWAPFAGAFAASSLPWWTWNAAHGWASLVPSSHGPAAPGWGIWRAALGERLAFFVRGGTSASSSGAAASAVALAALAALAAAAAFRAGRGTLRRRLVSAASMHALAFAFAYAGTGFGAPPDSSRYFFSLVPGFCLVAGIAASHAVGLFRGQARRAASAAVIAALVILAARQGMACHRDFSAERLRGGGLVEAAADLSRETGGPGAAEPFFAAYKWFGANAATDGAVICASPFLARVPRYIAALENSDRPGVFADYDAFSDFLASSGGAASERRVAGLPLLRELAPPPTARGIPAGAVASVVDDAGRDWTKETTDGNLATTDHARPGPDGLVRLTVSLREPTALCGVVLAKTTRGRATGWRAEAVAPDGSATPLSEAPRMRDWHWSGPRVYQGGSSTRWEMRWKPKTVQRLRLTFLHAGPDKSVRAADIRLLAPAGSGGEAQGGPDFSRSQREGAAAVAALRTALAELEARNGPAKILADRWLATKLGLPADPSTDPLLVAPERIGAALDARTRHDPSRRCRFVVEKGLGEATLDVLATAGLVPDETAEAGPFSVIGVAPVGAGNRRALALFSRGCVRFACGRPFVDCDPGPGIDGAQAVATSLCGGRAVLVSVKTPSEPVRPGDAVRLDLGFDFPQRGRRPKAPWCVADFVLDGRAVFSGACQLGEPHPEDGGADLPESETRVLLARVPLDAPPGDYEIRVSAVRTLQPPFPLRLLPGRVRRALGPAPASLPCRLRVGALTDARTPERLAGS